jgi:hypothetical protein
LSIYYSNVDKYTTENVKNFNTHHLVPVADLTKGENKGTSISPNSISNSAHDIDLDVDDSDRDSNDGNDELYRFSS